MYVPLCFPQQDQKRYYVHLLQEILVSRQVVIMVSKVHDDVILIVEGYYM